MKLNHNLHLAYCTNIHRGEDWPTTLSSLENQVMAVRERVAPDRPYAIGLRLGDTASRQLMENGELNRFRQWLDRRNAYVFTINGFPFGAFHGTRVKERVYQPDWTTRERLEYTRRLFDVLARIVPEGVAGSVSTLPGSFKAFIDSPSQLDAIRDNLFACVEHIAALSERTGRHLHLGLEPEPLGLFENIEETITFFRDLRAVHDHDPRLDRHLGLNYDTCHLAIEYEDPAAAIDALTSAGIFISKLHLSSALKVVPDPGTLTALSAFADDVYLHQVISRDADGHLRRYKDLGPAIADARAGKALADEWRVHFHIPLHAPATAMYGSTTDHLIGVLDRLKARPSLVSHLEMETYTWEVMPAEMKRRDVVDQLVGEYDWTLARLRERGLA